MCRMSDLLVRRELLEMALCSLAALGAASEFPQDRVGIEALIVEMAETCSSESRQFDYEELGALPRYNGDATTWLMPVGNGSLRVRRERLRGLASVAIVVHPDGRVSKFGEIEGFGVPDSELTDLARADQRAYDIRARRLSESEHEREQGEEGSQPRFRAADLLRVVPGPIGQDRDDPIVAYLSLYRDGVIVNYLMPKPADVVLDPDNHTNPIAEGSIEAMPPHTEIDDGLGTTYEIVETNSIITNSYPLRAQVSYAPAVPIAARTLGIKFETKSVSINLSATP
jgi:hypothetical protein